MSNYHVEPADKPQALTDEALKSLRNEAPKGLSRRQLLRTSLGAGIGLWLLEVTAGSLLFLWPNLSGGFGGEVKIGKLDDIKNANAALPIGDGFPAYYQEARAFVMLVDPSRQEFIPGEDRTGDGTALNVRALYQRCPHLGCKPNPCVKSFWLECACHGSRYDRLGTKVKELGPAPRGMDRFAVIVEADGTLVLDTSKITLGPAPGRARPARPRAVQEPDRVHLTRPSSIATSEEPDDRPAARPGARAAPAGPARARGGRARRALHGAAPGARDRPLGRACREDRPPERELALGRLPRRHRSSPSSSSSTTSTSSVFPGIEGSSRLEKETAAQQVTDVERRLQSSTRRTAPAATATTGQGGIGPVLNDQAKLLTHLTPQYLADGAHRRRPLRLRRPELAHAGLARAEGAAQLPRARGAHRLHPGAEHADLHHDGPRDGRDDREHRLARRELRDAGRRNPGPGLLEGRVRAARRRQRDARSLRRADRGSVRRRQRRGHGAVTISASGIAFDTDTLEVPADTPFQIVFTNNDAGIPHNVAIHEGSPTGPAVWTGEIFNGVETRTYDVPALPAGTYGFVCTVHPNMTGTLTAK